LTRSFADCYSAILCEQFPHCRFRFQWFHAAEFEGQDGENKQDRSRNLSYPDVRKLDVPISGVIMADMPDLLVIHGEWRMARLLRATLQCDHYFLHAFFDLLFQTEPEIAELAKDVVDYDDISATGEKGSRDDLHIPFRKDMCRSIYPAIEFNNLNVELKDERRAHQEKAQISRYIERAGPDKALVAYIRLDDDPQLAIERVQGINILEHPRYLRPSNRCSNFRWADLIEAFFRRDDKLKRAWERAVQVFCEKRIGEAPSFETIKTNAQTALSIEEKHSRLNRNGLAMYTDAVCDIYSMNIHGFQREQLKPAIEQAMRKRGVEASIKVTGADYHKLKLDLPDRTVFLKWSETLPVNRRPGAAPAVAKVFRAPCNWIDPDDGYAWGGAGPGDYLLLSGRPVFPYLSYDTVYELAKAVAAATC
jgi:hypothetical protein